MLRHSGLTDGFWAEALLTAVHIINMSPSRPLDFKIPQELWAGRKQDYAKLRIFGCEAYALVPNDERRKLDSRSRKCIFLGYGPDRNYEYSLWDPETRQVISIADVIFNESAMHKSAERPIEFRQVTFSDVTADGPAQTRYQLHSQLTLSNLVWSRPLLRKEQNVYETRTVTRLPVIRPPRPTKSRQHKLRSHLNRLVQSYHVDQKD